MSQLIQGCSVLLAALWFWLWSSMVFLGVLALFSKLDIAVALFMSFLVWLIGLVPVWWGLFCLADVLDRRFGQTEKKKKRLPLEL